MSLISKFYGNMNIIGKELRNYRLEKDLSYEELSAKLDLIGVSIHKQSLYDVENNKRTIKDYELFGLAYVLDIDLNALYDPIYKKFNSNDWS